MTGSPEVCASRANWRYFSPMWWAVPRIFTSGPLDSKDLVRGFGPLRLLGRPRIRLLFCPGLIDDPWVASSLRFARSRTGVRSRSLPNPLFSKHVGASGSTAFQPATTVLTEPPWHRSSTLDD